MGEEEHQPGRSWVVVEDESQVTDTAKTGTRNNSNVGLLQTNRPPYSSHSLRKYSKVQMSLNFAVHVLGVLIRLAVLVY